MINYVIFNLFENIDNFKFCDQALLYNFYLNYLPILQLLVIMIPIHYIGNTFALLAHRER